MGVKRIHLQLAAKRRWQTLLDAGTGHDANQSLWQVNMHQRKWTARQASSKLKVLP